MDVYHSNEGGREQGVCERRKIKLHLGVVCVWEDVEGGNPACVVCLPRRPLLGCDVMGTGGWRVVEYNDVKQNRGGPHTH